MNARLHRIRLTARGWIVVAVIILSVVLAWQYGPRALNAVVMPLVVIFVAGAITTGLADRPRVSRHTVTDGEVGESRTVTVTIETDRPLAATVYDSVSDGLSATEPIDAVTIDGEFEFRYEVTLDARGDHQLGPLSITVVDLFSLFERRIVDTETTSVLVYPPIYDVDREAERSLSGQAGETPQTARKEFDRLREYQHGDSLRDVNWKAAAKRPDRELLVTEYVADETGSVTIAAECVSGRADEMAAAVATVAAVMVDSTSAVSVILPDDRSQPGPDHRNAVRRLLALTDGGEIDDRDRDAADVLVQTGTDGTEIVIGDRVIPFDRLRGRGSESHTASDTATESHTATEGVS